jgi:uncharacterized membrane protein YkvA (DUF1232 family)
MEWRAMAEPELMPPSHNPAPKTSWVSAYVKYLRDPHQNKALKLMPLVLIGVVPLSIVDDFLLPVLGFSDDLPTWIVALLVLGMTWTRVRDYR